MCQSNEGSGWFDLCESLPSAYAGYRSVMIDQIFSCVKKLSIQVPDFHHGIWSFLRCCHLLVKDVRHTHPLGSFSQAITDSKPRSFVLKKSELGLGSLIAELIDTNLILASLSLSVC